MTCNVNELTFLSYFLAFEEDLTAFKFSRHLLSRWAAPDLKAYPSYPTHLLSRWPSPVLQADLSFPSTNQEFLLQTREESDICPTRLALGGRDITVVIFRDVML